MFLSHRGPDVKRNFCAFLEEALKRAGVNTFVDQPSLQLGDAAWDSMKHALETAELVMPVFSSGFVESSWCLDELELMMRKPENVLPIFYDAWPGMDKLRRDVHRFAGLQACMHAMRCCMKILVLVASGASLPIDHILWVGRMHKNKPGRHAQWLDALTALRGDNGPVSRGENVSLIGPQVAIVLILLQLSSTRVKSCQITAVIYN